MGSGHGVICVWCRIAELRFALEIRNGKGFGGLLGLHVRMYSTISGSLTLKRVELKFTILLEIVQQEINSL